MLLVFKAWSLTVEPSSRHSPNLLSSPLYRFQGSQGGCTMGEGRVHPWMSCQFNTRPDMTTCFALRLELRTRHFSAHFQTDWAATSPHLVTSGSKTQWGNQTFSPINITFALKDSSYKTCHYLACNAIIACTMRFWGPRGGSLWAHAAQAIPAPFINLTCMPLMVGETGAPKQNPQRHGENILTQHRKVSYLGTDSQSSSCEAIERATTPLCCYLK